jgi:hypothetical protein
MSAFHLPFGKERTKRSYIATAAFSTGFYSYDKTGTALNPVYTLNAAAAGTSGATVGNCTAGRILRENGRKLYPGGAYPGVTTLMVGVFFTDESGTANNFVTGYINPNSSFFAVFNSDKPIEVVDGTDAANSLINKGPSVFTGGNVLAVGSVTAAALNLTNYTDTAAPSAAGAATVGLATLVAGTVTINTTAVTANSRIFLTRRTLAGTASATGAFLVSGTITAGTSFVINSYAVAGSIAISDNGTVNWLVVS